VPNIDVAAAWLKQNLGFINPLTFGPFSDPAGTFMTDLVDVNPRAVVQQIRMLRGGNGPNVELFQYTSPDQDQTFRKNSDWGAHRASPAGRQQSTGPECSSRTCRAGGWTGARSSTRCPRRRWRSWPGNPSGSPTPTAQRQLVESLHTASAMRRIYRDLLIIDG